MALAGSRYIQSNDPGAVGFGYQWANSSTGILYERNTSNTAWVQIGNTNSANYGLLPLTGGTMTGAIAGVSGWAPETSPDFNTSAKLEGVNLATINDLSTLETNLENYVNDQIASALSSQGTTTEVATNLAIGTGTLKGATATTAVTIPLPLFSDGQQASEAQCKWIVSLYDAHTGLAESDGYYLYFRDSTDSAAVNPTAVRTFVAYMAKLDRTSKEAAGIQYMIIARR